jgi:hypothetical protein
MEINKKVKYIIMVSLLPSIAIYGIFYLITNREIYLGLTIGTFH